MIALAVPAPITHGVGGAACYTWDNASTNHTRRGPDVICSSQLARVSASHGGGGRGGSCWALPPSTEPPACTTVAGRRCHHLCTVRFDLSPVWRVDSYIQGCRRRLRGTRTSSTLTSNNQIKTRCSSYLSVIQGVYVTAKLVNACKLLIFHGAPAPCLAHGDRPHPL